MNTDLSLRSGEKVGVLGGSFDPPHEGHAHLSREALKRFHLDRVVWLVSPGNPLKSRAPASLDQRVAAARHLLTHPRIIVSTFEAQIGTRFTAQTLHALQSRFCDVRFVWLMGADNLAQFHRWQNWRDIMMRVPIGVVARPGQRIAARSSVASRVFRTARLSGRAARLLGDKPAPSWCFLNMPMMNQSSTAIRNAGGWTPNSLPKPKL